MWWSENAIHSTRHLPIHFLLGPWWLFAILISSHWLQEAENQSRSERMRMGCWTPFQSTHPPLCRALNGVRLRSVHQSQGKALCGDTDTKLHPNTLAVTDFGDGIVSVINLSPLVHPRHFQTEVEVDGDSLSLSIITFPDDPLSAEAIH